MRRATRRALKNPRSPPSRCRPGPTHEESEKPAACPSLQRSAPARSGRLRHPPEITATKRLLSILAEVCTGPCSWDRRLPACSFCSIESQSRIWGPDCDVAREASLVLPVLSVTRGAGAKSIRPAIRGRHNCYHAHDPSCKPMTSFVGYCPRDCDGMLEIGLRFSS